MESFELCFWQLLEDEQSFTVVLANVFCLSNIFFQLVLATNFVNLCPQVILHEKRCYSFFYFSNILMVMIIFVFLLGLFLSQNLCDPIFLKCFFFAFSKAADKTYLTHMISFVKLQRLSKSSSPYLIIQENQQIIKKKKKRKILPLLQPFLT